MRNSETSILARIHLGPHPLWSEFGCNIFNKKDTAERRSTMDRPEDRDLYELIGAERTSSISEIKKAYRKKALSCHPDKNPDNPRAAELFHELTNALEILTDVAARAAYDKIRDARQQAKLRVQELDSKRKKLKEELEAREAAYRDSSAGGYRTKTDEEKFRAEVERLQKEGSRQVEEEVKLVTQRIREELRASFARQGDKGPYRIKIKWKVLKNKQNIPQYDHDTLHRIFSKYGNITALVISPGGKSRALVEFEHHHEAEMAATTEIGYSDAPLSIERLWQDIKGPVGESENQRETFHDAPDHSSNTTVKNDTAESTSGDVPRNLSDAEFELLVLKNMRTAQEKKQKRASPSAPEGN